MLVEEFKKRNLLVDEAARNARKNQRVDLIGSSNSSSAQNAMQSKPILPSGAKLNSSIDQNRPSTGENRLNIQVCSSLIPNSLNY